LQAVAGDGGRLRMPSSNDTIAALATPAGTAALAVLRVSGPDTQRVTTEIFGRPFPPRVARFAEYRDRAGRLIDEAVVTFFQHPRSYTGEDSLEISCHGNPFIAQKILEDLFARGCRPAEAGEFTQRAFLSGRMDLSQAEAVMDVIHARSDRALAAANAQLRGALGQRLERLIQALLGMLARIEAYIDFPEEDLPAEDKVSAVADINHISLTTSELIATSRYGNLLREGVGTIIFGSPNAGKSSLLNALVGRNRALVSEEPGTTRDFIEERVVVGSHLMRLIDTAGLNPTPAPLERLGMEKTLERASDADIFLFVVDASLASIPPPPSEIQQRMTPENSLVVLNKSDLPCPVPFDGLPSQIGRIEVSALTGFGLEELRARMAILADQLATGANEDTAIAINARHAHALARAQQALADATAKLLSNQPTELVSSDLREALAAFGEITGRIDNERVLDALFATFCIGK
jgi:tRNA modification GTPase